MRGIKIAIFGAFARVEVRAREFGSFASREIALRVLYLIVKQLLIGACVWDRNVLDSCFDRGALDYEIWLRLCHCENYVVVMVEQTMFILLLNGPN